MPRNENNLVPQPMWPFPGFHAFLPWSPVQPDLYWNTESPERALLELCRNLEKLIQYAESIGLNVNELEAFYKKLEERFEDLEEGGLIDVYQNQVCKWINTNLDCIVGNAVRFVQFGLTEDGRLVATIPNNWDFLQFKTVMDSEDPDFGKLQIVY